MNKTSSNDSVSTIVAQAIDEMKSRMGNQFSLENINLAELERMTGISRQRLRTLKKKGFVNLPHGRTGLKKPSSVLSGYTAVIDKLLQSGITNSSVCFDRITEIGYSGSLSTVKRYISSHLNLVPARRQLTVPQGNRGRRYTTEPGEAFQMDWGFVKVADPFGEVFTAACFAMICHHCGKRYVEFFPNAKQENLFIGMIHAFSYLGIPEYVLTDNMKSVVIGRDFNGDPVWQKDYESFMQTIGFNTRLCKPRHPFTKGKVERLVRYIKENFIAGRQFWNFSDLNDAALEWCHSQNSRYHKEIDNIPEMLHSNSCSRKIHDLNENDDLKLYLSPERCISFDGFVTYEGRRFGVPFSYTQKTARVCRKHEMIYIYSSDLKQLLTTHDVTWSRKDRYCRDQFPKTQPEEFPTVAVHTTLTQRQPEAPSLGFEKFNFTSEEGPFDE